MGFYLRKSIRVGPFRFNLSKSGVGVSAGIRGLRVGTGPRGNYVHMGRGGLYYRSTLPTTVNKSNTPAIPATPSDTPRIPTGTYEPLEEIESAPSTQIVDSSSKELWDELNTKRAKIRLWPAVAVSAVLLIGFGSWSGWPQWLMILLFILGVAGVLAAYYRDILKKTTVLLYDFEAEMEAAYTKLHEAAYMLAKSAAVWHIEAAGKVLDRKYHAGADQLVSRKKTFLRRAHPPYVKTNIETIAIGVGKQTMYFFPDRVFVYGKKGVGVVDYRELEIDVRNSSFIEEESVPRDAEIIDKTWKYVNKSGGPDRRFKDNQELPVCRYEKVAMSSQTGLNELLQFSRCGYGKPFADAISFISEQTPREIPPGSGKT